VGDSGNREYGSPAAGPIGAALATWRVRRGLSQEALSARAGLDVSWVAAVEAGQEWVDRRRTLAALASALRLDIGELTGQPYPPMGAEHAEVRAVAHRLRKVLAAVPQRSSAAPAEALDEVERLLAEAVAADFAGDEHGLALVAPALISTSAHAVRETTGAARDRATDLRSRGHATAAGLLRRLGYGDLAWLLLHRARVGGGAVSGPLLAEEVRLLLDLGLPERALGCVERSGLARRSVEVSTLAAFAHAMAGRPERAAMGLDAAAASAQNPGSHAAVAAARVTVAAEAGDVDTATEYAAHVDPNALAPADRTTLLVGLAVSAASASRLADAAGHLVLAEATAPLRLRLDPLARELLVALPPRIADRDLAGQLRVAARRAGLS
jgi:transcriptional regulator with XRE-family HTH domain